MAAVLAALLRGSSRAASQHQRRTADHLQHSVIGATVGHQQHHFNVHYSALQDALGLQDQGGERLLASEIHALRLLGLGNAIAHRFACDINEDSKTFIFKNRSAEGQVPRLSCPGQHGQEHTDCRHLRRWVSMPALDGSRQ